MMDWPIIDVVIPALNEERALPRVLGEIPRSQVRRIIVVDNGSTDQTRARAHQAGAEVYAEPRRGYGRACLAGLAAISAADQPPDVVVFLDGDYSDHADELPLLIAPIREKAADLVVGSRVLGRAMPGALLPQARIGNRVATLLIRALYGVWMTDLGPFRAIRWGALEQLGMRDTGYGWTAEMQVKAARLGLVYCEVPVSYRKRIGQSKVTGTLRGSLSAGWKILFTVVRHARPGGSIRPSSTGGYFLS